MGDFLDRLKQKCPSCWQLVLAKRIEGRYVNDKLTRILIWECVECGCLWQKPRRLKNLDEEAIPSLIASND